MAPTNKAPVPETDKAAVLAVVSAYAKSLIQPDLAALEACFHDQATIFASSDGVVHGGHIGWLFDFMKQNGGMPGLEFEAKLLSITPTTAVAEVHLFRESPAYDVIDFQSLIKLPDGRWSVVSKTYHVYQG